MRQENLDYLRGRLRAAREAAGKAACDESRWAHERMAEAYALRVHIEELKAAGALPPGRVISIVEGLRRRDRGIGRGAFAGSGGAPATLLAPPLLRELPPHLPPLGSAEGQR